MNTSITSTVLSTHSSWLRRFTAGIALAIGVSEALASGSVSAVGSSHAIATVQPLTTDAGTKSNAELLGPAIRAACLGRIGHRIMIIPTAGITQGVERLADGELCAVRDPRAPGKAAAE